MKPLEPMIPQNPSSAEGKLEIKEIPIPQGTILYADVSDLTPEKIEGLRSFGVERITERSINKSEMTNYIPRKDWGDISSEEIPVTVIILGGSRRNRKVLVEKQSLKAEEVNEIIKLCFQVDLFYDYLVFSENISQRTDELMHDLKGPLEAIRGAELANPDLFELSSGTTLADGATSINDSIKESLAQFGVLAEKLSHSTPTIIDNIDVMIRKLNDLSVLAIQYRDHGDGMWWPIKKFIDEPLSQRKRKK